MIISKLQNDNTKIAERYYQDCRTVVSNRLLFYIGTTNLSVLTIFKFTSQQSLRHTPTT